jgi:hypothetical protein
MQMIIFNCWTLNANFLLRSSTIAEDYSRLSKRAARHTTIVAAAGLPAGWHIT